MVLAGLATAPGAAPVRGPEAPGAATAAGAPLDPYVQELLNRLNSTDPAKREAAQKQLAAIAGLMQSPEMVRQLQEITTDQELKDFFGGRIGQLKSKEEEKRIANLPGITLKVSEASASDLITALNTALEAPIKLEAVNSGVRRAARGADGGVADGSPTWTLDVKNKPFWEVFTALQEQQPLDLQNTSGSATIRVTFGGARGKRYHAIGGPAIAYVTGINYSRNINFPTPPGGAQTAAMSVNFQLAVDPRIRATRIQVPTAVKAVDDEGRDLARPNQGGGGYSALQGNTFNWQLTLNPPERLAKTLAISLDGVVATTVGDTPVAIDDLQKNVNKPMTLTNRTARVMSVTGDATNRLNVQLNVQPANDTGGGDFSSAIPFTVSDATGKTLYSGSVSTGTTSFVVVTVNAQPPFKMEFRVPGRSAEIPVHLEFKDLPLP